MGYNIVADIIGLSSFV